MSTEIELKLDLTPKAAGKLARHPLLAGLTTQKLQLLNTYYDTARLELHARRIAFRFRKKGWQWLSTVKTAEPASGGLALRSEWETEATPGLFEFEHVDNPELRTFLEDRRDALEPVFTTDFRRQLWQLPFGESVIELAVDRGTIESRGRRAAICEIELELLSGQVADLFALSRRLQDDIDLRPAIASKAERGYKLFLDEPLKPFKAKAAPILAAMTPVEAFRSIGLGCLEHFQRNETGLLAGDDPEFIHQARVALRRLRSAIKLFAPVLPKDFVHAYGRTWQTLSCALGEARDWDVFVGKTLPLVAQTFPQAHEIKWLTKEAPRRLQRARKTVAILLAEREFPCLLLEFTAAVFTLHDARRTSLVDFAHQQVAKRIRKARKLARRYTKLSPDERHRLRIAFKKLRYSLEFFSPLLAEKPLANYLDALIHLQDELGLINEHLTASSLIEQLPEKHNARIMHGWLCGRLQLLTARLSDTTAAWTHLKAPLP